MVVKERGTPIRILKLQSLLRRLNKNHSKRKQIQEDFAKCLAGYKGEESIDYFLQQLPSEKYSILHNINIPFYTSSLQMDTLIISDHCIFILEVKNFSGTLIFDQSFKQLLRISQGMEECFPDPILQVERQKNALIQFLKNQRISQPVIFPIVIISNPTTAIKTSKEHHIVEDRVIHAGGILSKVKELETALSGRMNTSKQTIIDMLLKSHAEKDFEVLEYYKINKSEILSGVECSRCRMLTMKRMRKAWVCSICLDRSVDAHRIALMDFYLLKDYCITNRQFREFTGLASVSTASKLLSKSALKKNGDTKGRSYMLDSNYFKNEMQIKI
ncbi:MULTISPECIES: nuclease-related domain-containing protein [Bacillaceae]|uniref:Nuclease-related domain-containing protein n=1 Tax=Metabacillus sediminis TaxID=3117746 RepID=A0ABZ2NM95_9BACI|nr:nuclease-related domain-containing protein [Bacillus sp. SJS]KZZ82996.1 hypothetical protein AS29_019585 [Bacillus sp. SJS]